MATTDNTQRYSLAESSLRNDDVKAGAARAKGDPIVAVTPAMQPLHSSHRRTRQPRRVTRPVR